MQHVFGGHPRGDTRCIYDLIGRICHCGPTVARARRNRAAGTNDMDNAHEAIVEVAG